MIVHMIGNAHIDPIWLWRWQQGADEALATFRSAADRCDEYPAFIFTRGEAWLYEQVERINPPLFARIQTLVQRGQWHITGGQYIQPDVNLPTEVGLHRQFAHGQRYFQQRFGVQPFIAYNVDTFGHPVTLPDILSTHGYHGYVFTRPTPSQMDLPGEIFRWRGPQGGEVLGMRIQPSYATRTDDLHTTILAALASADAQVGHVLCFYGVGNHGGGPTKANIEYIIRHQHAYPNAELRFSTPQAFYEAIVPHRETFPLVTPEQELQRVFPGCYSVMHQIKQQQRYGEHLLDQSEQLVTLLVEDDEQGIYQERIDHAWDDLLFTQFHDILAGTSIPSAWPQVQAMQGRAHITAEEISYLATRRWAQRHLSPVTVQQLVLVNPDHAPWDGILAAEPFLDFDQWGARWVSDAQGVPLPVQLVAAESPQFIYRVLVPATIPARGVTRLLIHNETAPPTASLTTDLGASAQALHNAHLQVELGPMGIQQITYQGTPLLGSEGWGLHLRQDTTDTWTFLATAFTEPIISTFTEMDAWRVVEQGPLRARVRQEGWLGHARIGWTLSLYRDSPRLDVALDVTMNEHFRLIQMPIHLATPPLTWWDGQAGGMVERRVLRDAPASEWPVHGWSRVAAPGTIPCAIVTQDAYSLSLDATGRWQWTLLRSPKMAWGNLPNAARYFPMGDRDIFTDQGEAHFAFTFIAGETALDPIHLATRARQQAQPPLVFDHYEGMNRPPWTNVPPPYLIFDDE